MEKKSKLIDYRTGGKQGDNSAPIIFIIVMQFLSDILKKKFKESSIVPIHFFHDTNSHYKCC